MLRRLRTLWALGLTSVAAVLWYRLRLRAGLHPVQRLKGAVPQSPFFAAYDGETRTLLCPALPRDMPQWHRSMLTDNMVPDPMRLWWKIADFDPAVGDIKAVWKASRFDFTLHFAQHAISGNALAIATLNAWIEDWCAHNPPYLGANWKCGQEASIRVMHLCVALLLLQQHRCPTKAMRDLLVLHLRRIAPTMGYAMAQRNNHATSEAAALFMGGALLAAHGDREGKKWMGLGRARLEKAVARLVMKDGSFSQYSVNYHRVLLDTLCMVECWRQAFALPSFSRLWMVRAKSAAQWLHAFVEPQTGDAPNLGAYDGARLLPLSVTAERDFRPCVQRSMALFAAQRAYADGDAGSDTAWLGIAVPDTVMAAPQSSHFKDGGYVLQRESEALAMLRYPQFRFRPSHDDPMHVDLWVGKENLLRDSGTYSYADVQAMAYFPSIAAHNTVQFDDREAMPRLGRFLFGDWLHAKIRVAAPHRFTAYYRDRQGAKHARSLALQPGLLQVTDQVEGFSQRAVLRWRLAPLPWELLGNRVQAGQYRLEVSADVPITRMELVQGEESREYWQRTALPVWEIELARPGTITTRIGWK